MARVLELLHLALLLLLSSRLVPTRPARPFALVAPGRAASKRDHRLAQVDLVLLGDLEGRVLARELLEVVRQLLDVEVRQDLGRQGREEREEGEGAVFLVLDEAPSETVQNQRPLRENIEMSAWGANKEGLKTGGQTDLSLARRSSPACSWTSRRRSMAYDPAR